jgi:hypothetical protein
VAALVSPHRQLLTAEFRRQYGISRTELLDLDGVEFCELIMGLAEGRLTDALASYDPTPATVEDAGTYLERVNSYQGRVVRQEDDR